MAAGCSSRATRRALVAVGLALLVAGGFSQLNLSHSVELTQAGPAIPESSPVAAGPAPAAGPYLAYGNSTIVLPGWNSLSAYAWNCNTNVSESVQDNCFSSPRLGYAGTQVPLVSWTASGAFYVNASLDLVFYSFLTHTVGLVAPWLPLFDNTMYYAGITNTEYITADGSWVYEFGCLDASCLSGAGTQVTSYAVNVSTGRTFEHNWSSDILTGTGDPHYTTHFNVQSNMVGVDGNDSILTLTVTWGPSGGGGQNGTIWAYNLWTGVEWKLADIPVFEANNLYWLPEFSQFFDVSADGTTHDEVVQELLRGTAASPALVEYGPFVYSTGAFAIGGVDGLWVDVTSREVAFQADWQGSGKILSVVAQLGPSGTIVDFANVTGPVVPGAAASPLAGEHRPSIVTGPPAFSPPQAGNPDAWLSDPLSPSSPWLPTNVSQAMRAWNVDGDLYYNTSYSVLTSSDQCERTSTNGTSCAILGTVSGSEPGTVWWTWQLGLSQFPFPSGAPLAEPLGPPPVAVTAQQAPSGVLLNWTVPSTDLDPMVNYSVAWGASPGSETNHSSLPGNATGVDLSGIAPGETVYYTVDAWNLHGPTGTVGNLTLLPHALPAPPRLTASFTYDPELRGTANLTVVLTEGGAGSSPIVNDTLSWGTSNGNWSHNLSGVVLGLPVGSGRVVFTVSEAPVGATYYFVAASWNSWGEGTESSVTPLLVPALPVTSPGPAPNGVVPILEVAGGVIAVTVAAAVLVIVQSQARRRGPPPSGPGP